MGKKRLDETKKLSRGKSGEKAREIWIQPLLKEILYIAGLILEQTQNPAVIWDNISLGTDFNGMITPIKAFKNAEKLPLLDKTLCKELKKLRATEVTLTGKTDAEIQEITDKIMWKNNLLFLEKHFH
jgi:hypothetical protein